MGRNRVAERINLCFLHSCVVNAQGSSPDPGRNSHFSAHMEVCIGRPSLELLVNSLLPVPEKTLTLVRLCFVWEGDPRYNIPFARRAARVHISRVSYSSTLCTRGKARDIVGS